MNNQWGIPALREDRLATLVPERVYAGGAVIDPPTLLFVWRTCRFPAEAHNGVLGFFVDDYRFEALWRRPQFYADQFARFGWGALIEPDFSTWADRPLVEQLWAIYRMRMLGRLYQEHGLKIIPNLAWSDERSFTFCFAGIPVGVPVVAVECRTAGQTDGDRRAFLAGLAEGVRQVTPQMVLVYGGQEHAHWLTAHLPPGPQYTLIESWTRARGRVRRAEEKQRREQNQQSLFTGGAMWVAEARAEAHA